mgnify:CR=1 FL=1|tara:strand:+ start:298 stop:747 length:450 start_codon:yes stop_codon:yes gene_type:complete
MPIKSFRGLLSDGGKQTIHLSTNTGSTGYKIKKIAGVPNNPGVATAEHVFKFYKIPQDTVTASVDFSDQTLLAVMYFTNRDDTLLSAINTVVFDNEVFNQDIYVTHSEISAVGAGTAANYYIELEQIKLDINENTVATLRDIRNITANE